MKYSIHCLFSCLLLSLFGCSPLRTNAGGEIIHSFKTGKISIESQIDPEGRIVISLKSLTDDTWFEFQEISPISPNTSEFVLKGALYVEDHSGVCHRWVDVQPLTVRINPNPVDVISLTGRTVHQSGKVTVLVSEENAPNLNTNKTSEGGVS